MSDQAKTSGFGGELTAEEASLLAGNEPKPQELPPDGTKPKEIDAATGSADRPDDLLEPSNPQRDEKGRFVPHQALHAEREEHKKTRAELNEFRERQTRLEERFRMAQEAIKPAEEPKGPPDPNEDIFGAMKWTQDQLAERDKREAERATQDREASEAQRFDSMVWGAWQEDSGKFARENPDFQNAARWLADTRDRQLQAFAMTDPGFASQQARDQQVNNELRQIIIAAAQQGRRPAELVYEFAKSWGYQPAEQKKDEAPTLPDQLRGIAKGQEQSKTVGQGSGRSGGDAISLEILGAMSEPEFKAWMKNPSNAAMFNSLLKAA